MIVARPNACTRILVATLAAALALQPLAASAAAITETLAEVPIQGLNPVKPNIMFTMDDSGSMGWDFLPDYVAWVASGIAHCRDGGQCGGANRRRQGADTRSANTILPCAARATTACSTMLPPRTGRAREADGTDLPCERHGRRVRGAVDRRLQQRISPGYPGATTGGTHRSHHRLPDTVWCWKTAPTTAEKQTADSNGSGVPPQRSRPTVRRRSSGNTTPAIAAGYNYPNASVTCSGTEKCKFVNDFTLNGNPYYYTISQVQFCSAKDAAGWGTAPCASQWDPTTYKYVRYGTGAANVRSASLHARRHQVGGIPRQRVAAANPSGRTYAQEMANFANWYAFYRTRIQSMKAASGIAFSALDQNSRVGFHTLWENSTLFTNVKDFTSANKQTWLTNVYKVNPNGGTPLPDAMWRVGELFAGNLAGSGLPGATDPLDPVTGKCQPNFHLLSTDGYWNSTSVLRVARQRRPDRARPCQPSWRDRIHARLDLRAPLLRGADRDEQQPRPISRCTTGSATFVRASPTRSRTPSRRGSTSRTYGLSIGARGTISYPNGINAITSGTANLASRHGRRRTGSHRRHVARGRQQPRQVFQREQRAAAGGEHRERAGRLHRSVGHRHRRSASAAPS